MPVARKQFIAALALIAIAVGIFYAYKRVTMPHVVACTLEAKVCPDGSTVGRTGPQCEFAACPPAPATVATSTMVTKTTAAVALGQTAVGLGVRIVPLTLVEDSRCPLDARCIQAGTVRVTVRIVSDTGSSTRTTLTLGAATTTDAARITLIHVSPAPLAGTTTPRADYRFAFEIGK